MKRITKIIFSTIGLILLINFLTPQFGFLHQRSIDNQITYLEEKFSNGLGEALQEKYPEGALFSNLIFALSLIEYAAFKTDLNQGIIEQFIKKTLTESAKKNYNEALLLPHGAFYNGWINYTLKRYVESDLIMGSPNKKEFQLLHQQFSERIIHSQKDSIQLLETYENAIWPADNLVCIASLGNESTSIKEAWLLKIKQASKDNLINHYGSDVEEIRGSSQALINYLLIELDSNYATASYQIYKNRFEDTILGMSLIKEYESYEQSEDIDSGPIIFGYGSVATIMNNRLQGKLDSNRATMSFGFLNLFGCPINLFGKKYYLLGKEPMFDIFMLWNSVGLLKQEIKN